MGTDSVTRPRVRGKAPSLHIAMASSEISPFAKTGGLGDVLGSLPPALEKLGVEISLIMPAYRSVLKGNFPVEDTGIRFSIPVSDKVVKGSVLQGKVGRSIPVYFIRADKYYERESLYGTGDGDFPDNAERFVFFSRAVLEILKNDPPAILHAHDWQTALSIAFLKAQPELYPELASTKTVFTVHNLGYQGVFWNLDWHLLNLDWRFFSSQYLEFFNKINFLKGGVVFADRVTTVSPTYAEEITTTEYGFGLEGVFQEKAKGLTGILNGIDYKVWNPETDANIAHTFSFDDLAGKTICKAELQKAFGLQENPDVPLIGMVTRLTSQKGCDLVAMAMNALMERDIQLVLLGDGEKYYTELFEGMTEKYPGKIGVQMAFDELKVHKIIAGADFILIPSRYEPCGLTQMYGLRYGTVPVVRATGGLKDTIQEFNPEVGTGNGFLFSLNEVHDFLAAIDRALECYQQKDLWTTLIQNGMKENFSWEKSARLYKEVYSKLLQTAAG
ncbi:MAG TPA: glycogen synthase GlgA [Dehalococcoidales bacterium]